MASQVLSGASNPTYTNNTGQNVRIVINYMNATATGEITLNWAGVSISETNVEAFGKHIACASSFYGDYFWFTNIARWGWWRRNFREGLNPRSALSIQNVAVRMPILEADFSNKRRFRQWVSDNINNYISGFSFSIALPLEVFLAPGQSFSAICGVYNIVAIKEDGN
jgi:hypothetical protein